MINLQRDFISYFVKEMMTEFTIPIFNLHEKPLIHVWYIIRIMHFSILQYLSHAYWKWQ